MLASALAVAGSGAAVQAQPRPGTTVSAVVDELPTPDLSRLEAPVREQLEGLDRVVRELARDTQSNHPELVEALGALGQVYAVYEMRPEAARCFDVARRLASRDSRWPYLLGLLHRGAGDLEQAAREIEQALELRPDDAAILLRLGDLHLALGRLDSADSLFRRAADRDPAAPAAWYGLGRVAASRGSNGDAIAHFTRATALEREGSIADYALAQAHRRAGDAERARAALERYRPREVSLDDPYAAALDDAAILASFGLLRALAGEVERFSEKRLLSYALSMLAATDGAIERLTEDLARRPVEEGARDRATRARLHYVAGGLLVQRDRQLEAIVELERALELDAGLAGARIELANTMARQARYPEALEHFSRAVAAAPSDPELRLKRAAVLQKLGRWAEAVDDLSIASAHPESELEARYRLVLSFERLGQDQREIVELVAAAAIDPDRRRAAGARHRAALALARRGDLQAAVAELERALVLDPGLDEARSALGAILLELDRPDDGEQQPVTPPTPP